MAGSTSAPASSGAGTVTGGRATKVSKRAWKWFGAVALIALFWGACPRPKPQTAQHAGIVVNEDRKVCPSAWKQEQDHVNDHRVEKDIPYFDVVLTQDACFEGDVWRPDDWRTWEKEFVSNEPDAHVSFWFHGWNPMGPYFRNNLPEFDSPPSREFRLKGKGTLRYFRTDK